MAKFGFSSIPSEKSLKIVMHEKVAEDLTISHDFYVDRETGEVPTSHFFSSDYNLLELSIEDLLSNLPKHNSKNLLQDPTNINISLNRPLLQEFEKVDNTLWCDKYQVSKYPDLATDDTMNREALIWLQSWNDIVFKTESKSSIFGKKPEKVLPKPLLLISGPPGCGKTTLAKVITSHFNYAPHEINCALLGSGKELLDTLKHSLSIKTVSGKPGILILDQIESIDKITIKTLSELLVNKVQKRPTIAITNDLYSGNLIPLRTISQVLHSKLINIDNLYLRLKEICANERIFIHERDLKNLIKENKSDIRACVNTIQLLNTIKKNSQVTIDSSNLSIAGVKESAPSVFDIWRQIFTDNQSKNLRRLITAYNDPDLINSGIHENYLNSKYADFSLDKSLAQIESLQLNDIISTRIRESQQFELYSTQLLPALTANRFCLSNTVELSYPVQEKKLKNSLTETQEAISSLKSRNLAHFTQQILVSDVFSFGNSLFGPHNLGFAKEVLASLGFEFSLNTICPDVKTIIKIPRGFKLEFKEDKEETKNAGVENGIQGIASQKRKRGFKDGPIFVFHEGLTNAVRRKVRVVDLL